MSTSIAYPGPATSGTTRAQITAAAGVITLAAAIAGTALVGGISAGRAIEAPAPAAPRVVTETTADPTPTPITATDSSDKSPTGGGYLGPLQVD